MPDRGETDGVNFPRTNPRLDTAPPPGGLPIGGIRIRDLPNEPSPRRSERSESRPIVLKRTGLNVPERTHHTDIGAASCSGWNADVRRCQTGIGDGAGMRKRRPFASSSGGVGRGTRQLISMSCPRAGPVGNLFRSMLKNGSTFMPSGPTWISRTQNRPAWSRVREERVGDVHPLAVAGHVHHVRLDAGRDGAEELRMVGVGDVPLLDHVVAEAADEEVAVVGALAQVGRQGAGVGDLLELVRAVGLAPEHPERVVEGAVGEPVVVLRLQAPAHLQRGQARLGRPGAACGP